MKKNIYHTLILFSLGLAGLAHAGNTAPGSSSNYEEHFVPSLFAEGTCAICTEENSGLRPVTTLSCSHTFHQECIDPWLVRAGTCPNCRKQVLEGVLRQRQDAGEAFDIGTMFAGDENMAEALGDAARNGHQQTVSWLLNPQTNSRAQEFTAENLGWALWWAARNGHQQLVAWLLNPQTNSRAQEFTAEHLDNALNQAVRYGHQQTAAWLLNPQTNSRAHQITHLGTALGWAIEQGHREIAILIRTHMQQRGLLS